MLQLRQDDAFCRRLVATAVSYLSTLYRGRLVRLQLTDGFAIVTPIDVERGQSQSLDGLDVLVSSVLESEDAKDEIDTLKLGEDYNGSFRWCHLSALKNAHKMLLNACDAWCVFFVFLLFVCKFEVHCKSRTRCWGIERWPSRTGITIAEMLRERCALQEVIGGDRVLRGAQNLLCKYRIGSSASDLLNITQF